MWLLLLAGCPGSMMDGLSPDTAVFVDDFIETGAGDGATCLDAEVQLVLGDWLHQEWLVAYGAPAQADPSHVVAFYQLPGVAAAPWFELELAAPCSDAHDLDPVCANGVCYQVECLGGGGSWVNHIQNDSDLPDDDITTTEDGWRIDRGRTPVTWTEGQSSLSVELDINGLFSPDGWDWTFSGTASFDGTLTLDATFPGIDPYGPAVVDIEADVGEVRVNDQTVATWDGQTLTDAGCWRPE